MKVLVVVDMQNDFIDGSLGTKEAQGIVENTAKKIRQFDGKVYFTRDTHEENYLETQEGHNLPVKHCIRGTDGWQLHPEIAALCTDAVIDKPAFGSVELAKILKEQNEIKPLESVTLIGLCTDICVISNAMLIKAFMPEVPIIVDAACCAGVTPQSHLRALESMQSCQMIIENMPM